MLTEILLKKTIRLWIVRQMGDSNQFGFRQMGDFKEHFLGCFSSNG